MRDNPQLDDIALFAAVAEAGSFVAAARRLRQPKSTVSRRLQLLEQDLGLRLIERTTRRLKLTEAGVAFLERVQPALAVLGDAATEARDSQREPTGLVRMATGAGLATPEFTQVVAAYLARYPRVTLELDLSDRKVDIVAEGFDLALRAGPLEDSALLQRKLGFARTVVVAAPALLARFAPPGAPADLRALPALTQPRQAVWTLVRGSERVELSVQGPMSVNNLLMLRQAARQGIGIAKLPRFICREDLAEGRLVALLPDWEPAGHSLHALLPSRQPTSAVRALVTHLEAHAADLFPD